jgi:hypothetical protein
MNIGGQLLRLLKQDGRGGTAVKITIRERAGSYNARLGNSYATLSLATLTGVCASNQEAPVPCMPTTVDPISPAEQKDKNDKDQ